APWTKNIWGNLQPSELETASWSGRRRSLSTATAASTSATNTATTSRSSIQMVLSYAAGGPRDRHWASSTVHQVWPSSQMEMFWWLTASTTESSASAGTVERWQAGERPVAVRANSTCPGE